MSELNFGDSDQLACLDAKNMYCIDHIALKRTSKNVSA